MSGIVTLRVRLFSTRWVRAGLASFLLPAVILLLFTPFFFGGSPLRAEIPPARAPKSHSAHSPSLAGRLYRYIDQSNKMPETGRPDFSMAAGPVFSSEEGLGLTMVGAGFFKTDSVGTLTPRSYISGSLSLSTSGSWETRIKGHVSFPGDKIRLWITAQRFADRDRFWGIGYGAGRLSDNYLEWRLTEYRGSVGAGFRVLAHTYAGLSTQISYLATRDIENPHELAVPEKYPFAWGMGPCVEFDTRSSLIWPERGVYVRADYKNFASFLQNDSRFRKIELTANAFFLFFGRSVLALDGHMLLHDGTPPWSEMAAMGNHSRMRGYYRGQYRDKNLAEVQAEWRQPIYRRHGMVFWVGAGNVFRSAKTIRSSQTLPNAGIGYRFEFKQRLHIRLDAGIGRNSTGAYINIGEAF